MAFFKGARESKRVASAGESLTVQSERERVSLSNIISRVMKGGGLAAGVPVRRGFYGDISNAPTFIQALNVVANAQARFAELPAKVRDQFNNDPATMLRFVDDPENKEAAIKLGLLPAPDVPPPPPEPLSVRIVDPPPVVK